MVMLSSCLQWSGCFLYHTLIVIYSAFLVWFTVPSFKWFINLTRDQMQYPGNMVFIRKVQLRQPISKSQISLFVFDEILDRVSFKKQISSSRNRQTKKPNQKNPIMRYHLLVLDEHRVINLQQVLLVLTNQMMAQVHPSSVDHDVSAADHKTPSNFNHNMIVKVFFFSL